MLHLQAWASSDGQAHVSSKGKQLGDVRGDSCALRLFSLKPFHWLWSQSRGVLRECNSHPRVISVTLHLDPFCHEDGLGKATPSTTQSELFKRHSVAEHFSVLPKIH